MATERVTKLRRAAAAHTGGGGSGDGGVAAEEGAALLHRYTLYDDAPTFANAASGRHERTVRRSGHFDGYF